MSKLKQSILIMTVSVITVTGVSIAYSWTGPEVSAPNGNVPAPINAGSVLQYKTGSLGIGGIFTVDNSAIFNGNVDIYKSDNDASLAVAGGSSNNSIIQLGSTADYNLSRIVSDHINNKLYFFNGDTSPRLTIGPEGSILISQGLGVNGIVQSTAGGFQFPDGTIQTTAFVSSGSGPQSFTIYPEADALVNVEHPTEYFGSATVLSITKNFGGELRHSYLKFDLAKITGRCITSAKLYLFINLKSGSGPYVMEIREVADNTWTEAGVTWPNRPGEDGRVLTSKSFSATNAWYEYDISDYIYTEFMKTSLAITGSASSAFYAELSSKEGSNSPYLKIETDTCPN